MKNDEIRDPLSLDALTDVPRTTSLPEWIAITNIDYFLGDFRFGWQGWFESSQLTPGLEPQDLINNPNTVNITEAGRAFFHDLTASYNYSDRIEFHGGITNVLDREPFIGSLGRPASPRGRFFFIGANLTF